MACDRRVELGVLVRPRVASVLRAVEIALCVAISIATLHLSTAAAEDLGPSLKAAFIYNFTKFTTWPAAAFTDDDPTLRVCFLDDAGVGRALMTIEDRPVGDRIIATRRLAAADAAAFCHVLVVGAASRVRGGAIVEGLGAVPVLTVGDGPDFTANGGIIGLVVRRNKLRFMINLAAAEHAGLVISARLLTLAEEVVPAARVRQ